MDCLCNGEPGHRSYMSQHQRALKRYLSVSSSLFDSVFHNPCLLFFIRYPAGIDRFYCFHQRHYVLSEEPSTRSHVGAIIGCHQWPDLGSATKNHEPSIPLSSIKRNGAGNCRFDAKTHSTVFAIDLHHVFQS